MNDIKPGQLFEYIYDFSSHFCYVTDEIIQNTTPWKEMHIIENNSIIMFVEAFDYTKEATAARRLLSAISPRSGLRTKMNDRAVWGGNAKKEFDQTGKITGGIFLTGNKRIWISHQDLQSFSPLTR